MVAANSAPDPVRSLQRPSAARSRILATADRLFYAEGIRAVGVDRVVSEAKVTRATFYRHFPSKDHLITAYLAGRLERDQDQLNRAAPGPPRRLAGRSGRARRRSRAADLVARFPRLSLREPDGGVLRRGPPRPRHRRPAPVLVPERGGAAARGRRRGPGAHRGRAARHAACGGHGRRLGGKHAERRRGLRAGLGRSHRAAGLTLVDGLRGWAGAVPSGSRWVRTGSSGTRRPPRSTSPTETVAHTSNCALLPESLDKVANVQLRARRRAVPIVSGHRGRHQGRAVTAPSRRGRRPGSRSGPAVSAAWTRRLALPPARLVTSTVHEVPAHLVRAGDQVLPSSQDSCTVRFDHRLGRRRRWAS